MPYGYIHPDETQMLAENESASVRGFLRSAEVRSTNNCRGRNIDLGEMCSCKAIAFCCVLPCLFVAADQNCK